MTAAMLALGAMTTEELGAFYKERNATILLPVGSVEPHGPHLPLATDSILSEAACARAIDRLASIGIAARIAPTVPYGVTEYASGFAGAIGVPAEVLTPLLRTIVQTFIADGAAHVCLVNNHLEPAHDKAVRDAIRGLPVGRASVACPLTREWARTLSDEFKRGDCHAGRYETSLVLAAGARVHESAAALPKLTISLSEEIRAGKSRFSDMGMDRAYTGAPAEATRVEGDALYERLVDMITAEICRSLALVVPLAPASALE